MTNKLPPPDGIIFDCDSTLSTIEGIDELAALKNCRDKITALTNQAMNGEVPLEAIYTKRLDIIRPSRADLAIIAEQYRNTRTIGALETIATLKAAGIKVAIISGGLRDAILPLAADVGINEQDVFAVNLKFDSNDNYQAVIENPLTTANGKRPIAALWKAKHGLSTVYLIGDGMSDVAAKGEEAANAVIGYGGVVIRDAVRQAADCYIAEQDLKNILTLW